MQSIEEVVDAEHPFVHRAHITLAPCRAEIVGIALTILVTPADAHSMAGDTIGGFVVHQGLRLIDAIGEESGHLDLEVLCCRVVSGVSICHIVSATGDALCVLFVDDHAGSEVAGA